MYKYRFYRFVLVSRGEEGSASRRGNGRNRERCTSKVSRVSEDFTVRRPISCLSWITRDCDVVLAATDALLPREN